MDELGRVNISSYAVVLVNGYIEAGVKTPLERKQKRKSKEPNPDQINIFSFDDEEDD